MDYANGITLIPYLNTGSYSFSHVHRSNTHNYGGGIGIIYKSSLRVSPLRDHNSDHSEAFTCSISPPHSKTLIYHYFTDPPLPQSIYSSLCFIHLPI